MDDFLKLNEGVIDPYWNPDWNSINPHVIKSFFIRGD